MRWRLLLAFHSGLAGYLGLAEKLLAPLLDPRSQPKAFRDEAAQILTAIGSRDGADLSLYRQALLFDYERLNAESGVDERLALAEALAELSHRLGDYPMALRFGEEVRTIRLERFHVDHPETLATRGNVATWTGEAGDALRALKLFKALEPDMVRVLGPDHSHTLTTRSNLARWTGEVGDAPRALKLFKAVEPDRVRVLGPDHPDTLNTRSDVARWTGEAGDARRALKLFKAVEPDMVRVLGPTTPTPSPPAPTSQPGSARWATPHGRWSCSRPWSPTWCGCSAPTTPTPSRRAQR
ncbi:MAG: tetratricopeptide repeat protein [Actinomycetota bacterium]|nr:tetratricopeptide repeat protein [Actinomycetota bacterium]